MRISPEEAPEPLISEGGMNRDATRVEAGMRLLGIRWDVSPTALDDVEPVVVRSNTPIEEHPESAAAPAMMPANAAARSAF